MKQKPLLTVFVCGMLLSDVAKGNESEPNNDRASANTLALNGNNAGKINPTGDQDWWKVTTTADGKLDLSLTLSSGRAVWIYLYDNNGTTLLNSNNSNSSFTVATDGLAAGTYYVKIVCYNAADTSSYKISSVLTTPVQANDAEPDSTRAQAQVLNLNGSTTGHSGYYYNNHRDSSDWFKLTTNADGLLRVSLTQNNGVYMRVYLYDNDGTTQLTYAHSTAAFSLTYDGLAPGTYYLKVICVYNTDFSAYTLSDSLFKPALANDVEPNDTKAQAITLKLNGSKVGHVGYYYNNHRDTADWYKLVTGTDGFLRLSLTSANSTHVWIYLYDNNGTTVINSAYANVPFSFNTDGLAAGTYFLRVKCFDNNLFSPYTLSDSLFTYSNAADVESNARPYLAKALPANATSTGHVGFYYNNKRDSADWWKINYTGGGALMVRASFEPRLVAGSNSHTYMEIWKDTLAVPIYSNYTNSSSLVANLTSLTQGYYWVRVRCYYNDGFQSYSLLDTFTQVNIAAIKATSYDTIASCSHINSVSFSCTNSSAPYTVKLYRYNVLYATKTAKVKNITFDTLPVGSYYAKAWGDGATGNAFGKSKTVNVVPIPTTLPTTGISATQATLNWTPVSCAKFDSIYYRVHGTTTWTKRNTAGNPSSYLLTGLTASKTYDWEIAAVDSANGIIARGPFSPIAMFMTTTTPFANGELGNTMDAAIGTSINNRITVLPNPAANYFVIKYSAAVHEKVTATLIDVNGKAVWTSGVIDGVSLDGRRVGVDQFAKGIFYLKIISENGELKGTSKVIVAR